MLRLDQPACLLVLGHVAAHELERDRPLNGLFAARLGKRARNVLVAERQDRREALAAADAAGRTSREAGTRRMGTVVGHVVLRVSGGAGLCHTSRFGASAASLAPTRCSLRAHVAATRRTDHRHHRPGRLLPGRAAARKGLRGPRDGPPLLDREVRADRAPARQGHAAPGRPARRALAGGRAPRRPASRDLQPRRDVVRRGLLDPADPDRGVHRRRGDADARGDARGVPGGALLPSLVQRDVRQGARGAADGVDRVLPALARMASRRPTGTSSRSTTGSPTTCTRRAGSSSITSRRGGASSS